MPSAPADADTITRPVSERTSVRETVQRSFLEGLAILLPLLVTVLVFSFVVGFFYRQLIPFVQAVTDLTAFRSELLVATLTTTSFVLAVFVVGFASKFGSNRARISNQFHRFMESIPAIGRLYTSFNQMSSLLLDSDTDSFQEVKLVEYPTDESYAVAFKTADTPEVIEDDTDTDEMVTLFMPMAPNPVMGGFVIHVSRDRVVDVELTVEEGVRSIITSGVAVAGANGSVEGLSEAQMRQLGTTQDPSTYAPVETDPATPDDGETPTVRDDG
jgi:uncharacterized membrane protein